MRTETARRLADSLRVLASTARDHELGLLAYLIDLAVHEASERSAGDRASARPAFR